jgi:hypothetical protein
MFYTRFKKKTEKGVKATCSSTFFRLMRTVCEWMIEKSEKEVKRRCHLQRDSSVRLIF